MQDPKRNQLAQQISEEGIEYIEKTFSNNRQILELGVMALQYLVWPDWRDELHVWSDSNVIKFFEDAGSHLRDEKFLEIAERVRQLPSRGPTYWDL